MTVFENSASPQGNDDNRFTASTDPSSDNDVTWRSSTQKRRQWRPSHFEEELEEQVAFRGWIVEGDPASLRRVHLLDLRLHYDTNAIRRVRENLRREVGD